MGEIALVVLGDSYQSGMLSKNVSTLFGNSDAKPAINGMKEITRSLVDALQQLTLHRDLKYLSCLIYKGVIKEQSLFRQSKAWCPVCFEQWRQGKKPIYEPLLWSFKDINYCLQHNCQLCDRCKKWLGNERNDEVEISEKELKVITRIGELIAIAPLLDSPPTLPDMIQKLKLIQFFFERSLRQDLNQFVALGKILEQLKIAIAQHQDKPLNLAGLLIPICSLAKISIAQFIKEDVSSMSKILDINFKSQIQ